MPQLTDLMEEGTVLSWLKQVGDHVSSGEGLVDIETDKATMTYEAETDGVLLEILAEAGQSVPVGTVIAVIEARVPLRAREPTADGAGSPPAPAAAGDGPSPAAAAAVPGPGGKVKASPTARRLAQAHDVDLAALAGSGPSGRVVKADVEAALSRRESAQEDGSVTSAPRTSGAGASAKGLVERTEPTKIQSVIARRMSESKATAPHFYIRTEVDMGSVMSARARIRETDDTGLPTPSVNDIVVKASAIALQRFPRANGAYRDGGFEHYSRINVGIAVAAEDALIVPTIFDADKKGLRQIASEARNLAEKVREGAVTPSELAGATFTVTNLGMFGVTCFDGVINPPQAAILAVGEVTEKPLARSGEIIIGCSMWATLSCDHRILNGADGAMLLKHIRGLLESPLALSL
jgi:pyruvate dehydrogenase E2 component (dihydrolipoamide acetyltransferase)